MDVVLCLADILEKRIEFDIRAVKYGHLVVCGIWYTLIFQVLHKCRIGALVVTALNCNKTTAARSHQRCSKY